ncbi:FKBP12-interacting protein of 37 kDa [Zostera marina]|uniref:FKBP12-interacting protein of 37 kDa n=1 Tax=Zostera marina TaxID=29655 RepID=A0A0K9P410_ZOSMR|nr:FKBP12-interacting protein of 37 kDa [Zostera marina]
MEDAFGNDDSGNADGERSGEKRKFEDLDDDEEDDVFGQNKGKNKLEENGPGASTGMILSLRESVQNYKDKLATCQADLEAQKSEVQKWCSSFENGPFIPTGSNPEPALVVNSLKSLKVSEESLREQLEKVKKTEAAFIVTFAKREQEISDLKSVLRDLKAQLKPSSIQARRLLLDPSIYEEFTRLKNLNEEKDKKIKELEENAKAVSFTSSSKMGKMLMAKCRTLQEENEEIGALASEGKMHELGMKLALQKSQNKELQNHLEVLYKHVDRLTQDFERSNENAFILQEQLEIKNNTIKRLKLGLSMPEEKLEQQQPNHVATGINANLPVK